MAIRVSLIEDDALTSEVLAKLIDGWPPLCCVSRHARATDAIEKIPAFQPHVVLVDLELGSNGSGIECIRELRDKMEAAAYLVYTRHDHGKWVFPALREGACGYIMKDDPPSRLLEAIHAAHRGESPMSSPIARMILDYFRQRREAAREIGELTARQLEILGLAAGGARDSEIADKLEIGQRTVASHFRQIYQALHAKNRAEAIAKYARSGAGATPL